MTTVHNLPDAWRLARYFGASVELIQVLARACGHSSLSDFGTDDLSSWKREMADPLGVAFAGEANHLG